MTLGQLRVGHTFNPSNNPDVDEVKDLGARFIDKLEDIRRKTNPPHHLAGEFYRLIAHAQTLVEDAAMNGVKAATKQLEGVNLITRFEADGAAQKA